MSGTRSAGWTRTATAGRKSISPSSHARPRFCRSAFSNKNGGIMAVKLAKVGGEKKKVVEPPDTDIRMPTTQVKMGTTAPTARYDPLATVSIMDQLKTSPSPAAKSKRLPVIGHLPMAKQIQMLGLLLIAFLALAVLMLFLDGR